MENGFSQVVSLHDYRCSSSKHTICTKAPSTVAWTHLPERGRGLIACADIEAGAVVDVAPAIPVREEDCDAMLRQYVFMCRRDDCPQSYDGPVEHALVFGPMSLCNHADEPNADVCFVQDESRGLEARLVARSKVRKGEEVTIRYTDQTWYTDSGRF